MNQPEENEGEKVEKTVEGDVDFKVDGTIFNLGYLVNVISDYYSGEGESNLQDGETWKKGTEYEPPSALVPKDVDDLVRAAFICQLKKFNV